MSCFLCKIARQKIKEIYLNLTKDEITVFEFIKTHRNITREKIIESLRCNLCEVRICTCISSLFYKNRISENNGIYNNK
jgi:hypothetical protein